MQWRRGSTAALVALAITVAGATRAAQAAGAYEQPVVATAAAAEVEGCEYVSGHVPSPANLDWITIECHDVMQYTENPPPGATPVQNFVNFYTEADWACDVHEDSYSSQPAPCYGSNTCVYTEYVGSATCTRMTPNGG